MEFIFNQLDDGAFAKDLQAAIDEMVADCADLSKPDSTARTVTLTLSLTPKNSQRNEVSVTGKISVKPAAKAKAEGKIHLIRNGDKVVGQAYTETRLPMYDN